MYGVQQPAACSRGCCATELSPLLMVELWLLLTDHYSCAVLCESCAHWSGLPGAVHRQATPGVGNRQGEVGGCLAVAMLGTHHRHPPCAASMAACCLGVLMYRMQSIDAVPFTRRKSCLSLQTLNLSPALATGLILVSCCPGGQVSAGWPVCSGCFCVS